VGVACSWKRSESTQKTNNWATPIMKARKLIITPCIWLIHVDSWVMEITAADYFLDFCVQKSSYQYGFYSQWLQCYGLFFNSYKHAPMNCTYSSWSLLNAMRPSGTANGNNTCIQNRAARCVVAEDLILKNLLSAKIRVN
jgi:hypothetical protein